MDRRQRSYPLVISILLLQVFFGAIVHAQSQRVIEYEYDGAGNLIGIRSELNTAPPDVTDISPRFVEINTTTIMVATGTNLSNALVTTTTPGLTIANVQSQNTRVTFAITAGVGAVVGPGSLTFTTRLGSDVEGIRITERVPIISTEPSPIVLEPDGIPVEVTLRFDQPFSTDQTFEIAVRDSTVADVTEQSVTLSTGDTVVTIHVTGLIAGTTTLDIQQPINFLAIAIPVIVVEPTSLPGGDRFVESRPLGILRHTYEPVNGEMTTLSGPIGVLRNSYEPMSGDNFTYSRSLGVLRTVFESPVGDRQAFSAVLGVSLPPLAERVTPSTVTVDTLETLTITGIALDAVTDVSFFPSDGISQTAPFSVEPDATQLNIFIDVAIDATPGSRQIILMTNGGPVRFSVVNGEIMEITE